MTSQWPGRLLFVVGIAAACSSREGPRVEESTLFRTDSQSYTLQPTRMGYEAVINVQFTNRNADTVYFMNCNGHTGAGFEKLRDSTWSLAWIPGMNACASAPIAVAPGGTHTFPTHAFAARPDRVQSGEFTIDSVPGTYRILWPYSVMSYRNSPPFGDSLPLAQRVSNSFTLSVSPRAQAAAPVWHERKRLLDVTGDGIGDTLSLRALGTVPESLAVVLTFIARGREVFRQAWGSDYELVDPPFPRTAPREVVERFLRARFDSVLAGIALAPLDKSSLDSAWTTVSDQQCQVGDEDVRNCIAWDLRWTAANMDWSRVHRDSLGAVYKRIGRAPFDTARVLAIAEDMRRNTRHEVHLAYGYETGMTVAWSRLAQRFFTLSSCC